MIVEDRIHSIMRAELVGVRTLALASAGGGASRMDTPLSAGIEAAPAEARTEGLLPFRAPGRAGLHLDWNACWHLALLRCTKGEEPRCQLCDVQMFTDIVLLPAVWDGRAAAVGHCCRRAMHCGDATA